MDIKFPAIEGQKSFDVVFPADVDGTRVMCKVTIEVLQDHFGADANGAPAFAANRAVFEQKAEQKIRNGHFQPEGTILISTTDFR